MGRSGFRKVLLVGLFVVPALAFITLFSKTENIERDLTERALSKLAENHDWAKVEVDGRTVKLSGTAPTPEDRDQAIRLVDGVAFDRVAGTWGVKSVDATGIVDLAIQSPYQVSVQKELNEVVIEGFVPRESVRANLLDQARNLMPDALIKDELSLGGGAPVNYQSRMALLLDSAAKLANGKAEMIDDTVSVDGIANSADDYRALSQTFSNELPDGLKATAANVIPPAISPYLVEVTKLGDNWNLTGYLPDDASTDNILNYAEEIGLGAAASVAVLPASGAPENISEKVKFLLEALRQVEEGRVTLSDDTLSAEGLTGSVETYRALRSTLSSDLPEGLVLGTQALSPPSVSPFVFSAQKTEDEIRLSGHVSSDEAGALLLEYAKAAEPDLTVTSDLIPASGGPDIHTDRARFILDLLPGIRSGTVSIEDDALSVRADTVSDEEAGELRELLGSTLPFGMGAGLFALTFPEPDPVVPVDPQSEAEAETAIIPEPQPAPERESEPQSVSTAEDQESATDQEDGSTRETNTAAADSVLNENGNEQVPDQASAEQAAVSSDGSAVGVSDEANAENQESATAKTSNQEEAAVAGGSESSALGTQTPDVDLTAQTEQTSEPAPEPEPKPEPVSVSPYTFAIKKNLGRVTVSGFTPSEEVRAEIIRSITSNLGDRVVYELEYAIGEPDNYSAIVQYGSNLLSLLKSGALTISDSDVSISGTAKSLESFDEVSRRVENAPGGFVVKATEVLPPRISPFAVLIERTKEGITIKGAAPGQTDIDNIEEAAKRWFGRNLVSTDLIRGSGEPANYRQVVQAGISAVSRLTEGAFSLTDDTVSLTGTVPFGAPINDIKAIFQAAVPNAYQVSTAIKAAAPPTPRIPERCTEEILSVASKNEIYFDTGKAAILAESFGLLDEIVEVASSCPTAHFTVAGHTDSDGSEIFNLQLSKARAISVVNYLVQSGIERKRLNPVGFGETQPVVENDSEENKALNRRMEFSLEKIE